MQLPADYDEDFCYMLIKLYNDLTLLGSATLAMCKDASLLFRRKDGKHFIR